MACARGGREPAHLEVEAELEALAAASGGHRAGGRN
jgi:hypothetical protein